MASVVLDFLAKYKAYAVFIITVEAILQLIELFSNQQAAIAIGKEAIFF